MSLPRSAGLRGPATLAIATAAITALAITPTGAANAAPAPATTGIYLIQLEGAPLAAYTGGVAGIPATRATPGTRLDAKSRNATAYREHLRTRRADVLRKAKVDSKKTIAEYDTVVNGVAAKLTGAEVAKLRATPGVVRVWKNEVFEITTTSTPKFLGLDGAGGAWTQQFGDVSRAGEGVIVGIVDTGIWPESPSFAALPEPRPDADTIAGKWQGECVAGEPTAGEEPVTCNNKLIGARWYNFGSVPIVDDEFNSPRDFDGHGSHTASTAAGNHNVPAVINGVEVGRASGMAPAARLSAYKICYERADGTTAACGGLETVAAIDDAVADGVDVINFSISGSMGSITDLTEQAFFHAAAAGVFVAASAGNSGPGASTVAHNSPWTTTVAASTHDRSSQKSVTLGDGTTYTGAGLGPAVPSAPLVDSASAALSTADPADAELCMPGTLDPAKVTGAIVLCARGVIARTDKSLAVRDAGGVGMVMYNPTPNSLNADFHFVPTVHLGPTEGTAIKAYLAGTASPTATLGDAVQVRSRAPGMATFSSAGPAISGSGDLLKPDVTAPGVDVLAAVSPPGNAGNAYNALSGTSMSSPHIAGIAALIKAKHPTWSPMAVKSAIMTTATTLDNSGAPIQRDGVDATPLDYGAGHVRPTQAFDPGLVYESSPLDWIQYTCGVGEHQQFGDGSDVCATSGSIDPSNLNYPSISVGDLAAKQTITRTVRNTTGRTSAYLPKIEAPAGFSVKVTPSILVVLPHRSASFKVEITRTGATNGQWAFGSLTWADLRGHVVRSPLAVRAADVAAVGEITTTGVSGSVPVSVRTNFNGTLTAKAFGLVQSDEHRKHLVGADAEFDADNPAENPAVGKVTITVPAGSKVARFATFDSDYPVGTDLDLYVYKDGESVGSSGGGSAQESVSITEPGTYDIYVVQFSLGGGLSEQDAILHAFLVGDTTVGNLTVTPGSQRVTAGNTVTVTASWSGLTPGRKYLGVIEYGNNATILDQTAILLQT